MFLNISVYAFLRVFTRFENALNACFLRVLYIYNIYADKNAFVTTPKLVNAFLTKS